jgi:hypothetical protein
MPFARCLLFVGAAFSTLAMAGIWQYARGLVDVFKVISWHMSEPPLPDMSPALTRLTLCALLLAVGLLLVQRGLTKQHRVQALAPVGKFLVAVSGLGLMIGGILVFLGIWRMHASFMVIARSEAAPKSSEIDLAIGQAATCLAWGPAIATLGLMTLVALAVRGLWGEIDPAKRPASGRVAVLVATIVAILGTAISLVLACRAGLACLSMLEGESAIRPSDVAVELFAVLRYGLLSGVGLAFIGAVQSLGVFTFPASKGAAAHA